MNLFKFFISIFVLFGILIVAKGDFSKELMQFGVPKGVTLMTIVKNLQKNTKYLSLTDHQKYRVLKALISIMKELTKQDYSVLNMKINI
jgi:hypothetical protein